MEAPSPAPINDWLLDGGRSLAGPDALLDGLCSRLTAAGVPVWRGSFHLPQLHPQLRGASYVWRADTTGVERSGVARQAPDAPPEPVAPMTLLARSGRMLRRRLAGGDPVDLPLLEMLRDQGGTDYVLLPVRLGNGRIAGFSLTTRIEGGFPVGTLALVEGILPALSAVLDAEVERATGRDLLTTYVGREAARRILGGEVTLATAEPIEAVILFCDLRDFTALSETLPRRDLLTLLNGYFGCMVGAVHRRDGEVLKFLGDGLLAVFRLDEGESAEVAAAKSIIAAFEAVEALGRFNERRRAIGAVEARCGIALHVGPVLFGNVGAEGRLDFTVIGPVVNKAARLESLCAELGLTIVTSREFADTSPVRLRSMGRHPLKGLGGLQEVFAPDSGAGLRETDASVREKVQNP